MPHKSHLGMCMVTRGHFITIEIISGGGARARKQRGRCPPFFPFFSPLWRRPWLS